MQPDPNFVKIQPSSGILKDKQGRTIALVLIFRPDVIVEDQHWFEAYNTDHDFLCVETGSDKLPVNCKMVYSNSDGPNQCIPFSDEKILESFKLCYKLLIKKNGENDEMQRVGREILNDMISEGKEK